jgi:hypothetical protein
VALKLEVKPPLHNVKKSWQWAQKQSRRPRRKTAGFKIVAFFREKEQASIFACFYVRTLPCEGNGGVVL